MPQMMQNGAGRDARRLASRTAGIAPFRVVQILERARELERAGRHVVHFEVGEPDFPTAPPIVEAGVEALSQGRTGYTQALGLPALRAAIAERYSGVDPRRVAVTTGASGALNLLAQVLIDPGDEVLVPDPGYPCNAVFIEAAGGAVRRVPVAATGFQIESNALASAWRERTAGVLLASPANPTGSVLHARQLGAIRDFVAGRGFVVVDEIYQGLVYDRSNEELLTDSALTVDAGFFIVNSFSKYFGMTGWRLGWLVAPHWAMDAIERVAQNLYIAPPTVAQYAALAALQAPAITVHEQRRRIFARRRDTLLEGLDSLGLPVVQRPAGAFYAYVDVAATGVDSETLCTRLIEDHGVAITPGSDFGESQTDRYVRFAYTVDEREIVIGIERIRAALRSFG